MPTNSKSKWCAIINIDRLFFAGLDPYLVVWGDLN